MLKKMLAKKLAVALDKSADTTAVTYKIIIGAQKLPAEMKK